jgi:predicted metal-dependent enzyme (double-stranded beta helix superfamily)
MKLNTNAAAAVASIVDPIRRAVEQDRITTLAPAIAKLQEAGAFSHPEFFASARADRYSRRLIWADPNGRFVIVGMTWAPGQGAPLHDHAGQWGIEAIVEGAMKQTAYRLVDRDAQERYRFMREGEEIAPAGTVSVVIPPLEYHAFANASPDVSRTVHVYGSTFERCQKFSHDADGWWRAQTVELRYDA